MIADSTLCTNIVESVDLVLFDLFVVVISVVIFVVYLKLSKTKLKICIKVSLKLKLVINYGNEMEL